MREKLIELLKECFDKALDFDEKADYLISNGVIVAGWIPVTERLPSINDDVLCNRGSHIGTLMDVYTYKGGDEWEDTYGNLCYTECEGITHWMPLPTPPKGE